MMEGRQGLRLRVKQKIEIQKPHFSDWWEMGSFTFNE